MESRPRTTSGYRTWMRSSDSRTVTRYEPGGRATSRGVRAGGAIASVVNGTPRLQTYRDISTMAPAGVVRLRGGGASEGFPVADPPWNLLEERRLDPGRTRQPGGP